MSNLFWKLLGLGIITAAVGLARPSFEAWILFAFIALFLFLILVFGGIIK